MTQRSSYQVDADLPLLQKQCFPGLFWKPERSSQTFFQSGKTARPDKRNGCQIDAESRNCCKISAFRARSGNRSGLSRRFFSPGRLSGRQQNSSGTAQSPWTDAKWVPFGSVFLESGVLCTDRWFITPSSAGTRPPSGRGSPVRWPSAAWSLPLRRPPHRRSFSRRIQRPCRRAPRSWQWPGPG